MHQLLDTQLHMATQDHLPVLLPLVAAYHSFEKVEMNKADRQNSVETLVNNKHLGGIWLISNQQLYVGYIVLGYGYSIEFKGRDAFVDEFYISEPFRNKGIGHQTLQKIQSMLPDLSIRALHLEVARDNPLAQSLYKKLNFKSREKYLIMSYDTGL